MEKKYVLAVDQGTTSSRSILFDKNGKSIAMDQKDFTQYYPHSGWVEHDALEIWNTQLETIQNVIKKARITPKDIVSIGITNQRETTVVWEKATGKPVSRAIVWQCRRTYEMCRGIEEMGLNHIIKEKTGLVVDSYFSASKLKWILDNGKDLHERAEKGELCFGTIDSCLLFNLTKGVHATDPSNASRTMLFNINTGRWDVDLLEIFNVPKEMMPEVKPSSSLFGKTRKDLFGVEIPITGIAGDQQASLFGQACFKEGDCKNTYGTGCFALINVGKKPHISKDNLITTVAWDLGDGMEYAIEGSVFVAGALIKWLRDDLGLIGSAEESEKLANSVPDTNGVFVVPAFVGLGAPHWDPNARGSLLGLTRGTTKAHIVRAALESVAFLSKDLIRELQANSGKRIRELKVDGGMSTNSFLMQFQADVLGFPVVQANSPEITAMGVAYLSGLYSGYWDSKEDIIKNWKARNSFNPSIDMYARVIANKRWIEAVKATRSFKI